MIYPERTLIGNNSIYYLIKVANSTLHIFIIFFFLSKSMQVSLMSGDHIVDRNSEHNINRMRKLDVYHAFHTVLT